ncbi:MAG: DUF222 domain-containing protein [Acidimicrobiia bacterium]
MFDMQTIEPGTLPADVAEMPPGARLGALLEDISRKRLNGHDRVLVLRARARQVAHDQALLYADILAVRDSISDLDPSPPDGIGEEEALADLVAMELQAALMVTYRSALANLDWAEIFCERLPEIGDALLRGLIDVPRARVIGERTSPLDQDLARRVATEALRVAPGLTTGQLRARVARLVISVDPDAAKKRYEESLTDRRVVTEADEGGTAGVFASHLPAAETKAAMRNLNRLARAAKGRDDPRSMDQVRADVFLDLLNGRTPHGASGTDRGVVNIAVDLATLAGLNDDPGSLAGWGPVIADVARRVVDEQHASEHR